MAHDHKHHHSTHVHGDDQPHAAHGDHGAPAPYGGHGHHGSGGHDHGSGAAGSRGTAFVVGISLNLGFVLIEGIYGVLSHSMALFADASHNLGDVVGLGLAWGASSLARRRPSKRRTYGFRRTTILAALANAVVLSLVTGGVIWESILRLLHPAVVAEKTVIAVALIGVVINTASALLFHGGHRHDLNVQSAFVHLASDAALSLGVALTGVVILYSGQGWLDPVVSLILSAVILLSTWSLLRRSFDLVMDAVPEGIDPELVGSFLSGLPGVREVHDLHIWAMSTTETALTAHLVMPVDACHPCFLADACRSLHERFGIEHSTLQLDPAEAPDPCRLAASESV